MKTKTVYVVEADCGLGFAITDIADSAEAADQIKAVLEREKPVFVKEYRVLPEVVPAGPEELFVHVMDKLAKSEHICIDDCGCYDLSLHISWGDWKHEHLRTDHVMGLYGFVLESTEVDEEDGSDCYSAWRTYSFGKEVL